MNELHKKSIVIDGLIIAKFSKEVFNAMQDGGITAANCTVSVWEGFQNTVNNICDFNKFIDDNSDILLKVRTTKDILRAKKEGKTGIILGFQNAYALEDKLGYAQVFKDLGVGVIQMAYNTQNLICTGCYEEDKGLSDYGREVVDALNTAKIVCDLSHVGRKSSEDVITHSKQPVCYSHCLPYGLKEHPRNKTDHDLKFIADRGGFVGVTMFAPFLAKGVNATIDDYVEAINYTINLVGEDSVGIGTDFTEGCDQKFFDWITHDKGYARRLTDFGKIVNPLGMRQISDFPNLTEACLRAGWSEDKTEKIIGKNWLKFLAQVWGE